MNTAPKLPSVPNASRAPIAPRVGGGHLARRPGAGAGAARHRRAALGIASLVVVVAVLGGVLAASGRVRARAIRLPGIRLLAAKAAAVLPARQASPPSAMAEAMPVAAPAQPEPRAKPRAAVPRPATDRVAVSKDPAALFAKHSWYVAPPPPPPAPPAPPPEPTAPPLPYTFIGRYAPEGESPVFFLARGDRVVDAHVGDKLDGVYQFESANADQLVFIYLPLNVRQNIASRSVQ